jgi:hypothetical protein
MQCQLVLLAEVRLKQGKSLGSLEGKGLGSALVTSSGKRLCWGFTAYDRNFDINVGRAALG